MPAGRRTGRRAHLLAVNKVAPIHFLAPAAAMAAGLLLLVLLLVGLQLLDALCRAAQGGAG